MTTLAQNLVTCLETMPIDAELRYNGVTVRRTGDVYYTVQSPGGQPGTICTALVGVGGGGLPADWNHGEPQQRSHGASSAAHKILEGSAHA